MAVFNPSLPQTQAPDFSYSSRGQGASQVFSTLFGGAGQLAGDFAKAKNTKNQEDIYANAVAQNNAVAQPYADALANSGASSLPDTGLNTAKANSGGDGVAAQGPGANAQPVSIGSYGVPGAPPAVDPGVDPNATGATGATATGAADQLNQPAQATSTNPQPLPPEVQNGASQVQKLGDALANGTITQAYHDNQILAIQNSLIAKYPGYVKEINQTVQAVTGRDPATALVSDYFTQATANASAQKTADSEWNSYISGSAGTKIALLAPGVYDPSQAAKYASPAARLQVKGLVAASDAHDYVLDAQDKRNAYEMHQNTLDADKINGQVQSQGSYLNNQLMQTLTNGDDSIMSNLDAAATQGIAFPADKVIQLNAQGNALITKQNIAAQAYLDSPVDGIQGDPTYGSYMTDTQIATFKATATASVTNALAAVNNKDYGVANQYALSAKVTQDQGTANALQQSMTARALATAHSLGFVTQDYINANPSNLNAEQKLLGTDLNILAAGGSVGSAASGATQIYGAAGGTPAQKQATTAAVMNQNVNDMLDGIQNNKNPDIVAKEAKYLFGPDNQTFITQYYQGHEAETYSRMTSPSVQDALKAADANNPGLWQMYETWSTQQALAIFKPQMTAVQDTVTNVPWASVNYNPNTHSLDYNLDASKKPAGAGSLLGLGANFDFIHQTLQANQGRQGVVAMNAVMASIVRTSQIDGTDPNVAIVQMLRGFGFDPNAPANPSIISQIGTAATSVVQSIGQGAAIGLQVGGLPGAVVGASAAAAAPVVGAVAGAIQNNPPPSNIFGLLGVPGNRQSVLIPPAGAELTPGNSAPTAGATAQSATPSATTLAPPGQTPPATSVAPPSGNTAATAIGTPPETSMPVGTPVRQPASPQLGAKPSIPTGTLSPSQQLFNGPTSATVSPTSYKVPEAGTAVQSVATTIGRPVPVTLPSGKTIDDVAGSVQGTAKVVKIASDMLNLNETSDTKTLSAFMKNAAGIDINPAQTAWCAAWVNAVLSASGYSQGRGNGAPGTVGNGEWAFDFENYGTDDRAAPKQGDVVVFRWNDGGGHVGFYMGTQVVNGQKYYAVLGGNQGGAKMGGGGVSISLEPADQASAIRSYTAPTELAAAPTTQEAAERFNQQGKVVDDGKQATAPDQKPQTRPIDPVTGKPYTAPIANNVVRAADSVPSKEQLTSDIAGLKNLIDKLGEAGQQSSATYKSLKAQQDQLNNELRQYYSTPTPAGA